MPQGRLSGRCFWGLRQDPCWMCCGGPRYAPVATHVSPINGDMRLLPVTAGAATCLSFYVHPCPAQQHRYMTHLDAGVPWLAGTEVSAGRACGGHPAGGIPVRASGAACLCCLPRQVLCCDSLCLYLRLAPPVEAITWALLVLLLCALLTCRVLCSEANMGSVVLYFGDKICPSH